MPQKRASDYRRSELMMTAVEAVLRPAVALPSAGSECKARCVKLKGADKQDCLNECEATEAAARVAERLRRDLLLSFRDIVWGGGDIDPVPDPFGFEAAVRNRFFKTDQPPKP